MSVDQVERERIAEQARKGKGPSPRTILALLQALAACEKTRDEAVSGLKDANEAIKQIVRADDMELALLRRVAEAAKELWDTAAEEAGNPTAIDVYDVLKEPLAAWERTHGPREEERS